MRGPKLPRDELEPLGGAGEVGAAEIAGARSGAVGGVREPEPEARELELLTRLHQPRGEVGIVKQAPEVVARIREVRSGSGRHPTRVDPAEDDVETGLEDVRNGAARGHGSVALL